MNKVYGCWDANTRTEHKFLTNFSNDTDVTQQKFISQLIIQDETWTHHYHTGRLVDCNFLIRSLFKDVY